jgi:hypothetical protein
LDVATAGLIAYLLASAAVPDLRFLLVAENFLAAVSVLLEEITYANCIPTPAMAAESGQRLEGDAVIYALPGTGGWRVVLDDLRLIGEYTNEDGPFADDYFLVFATEDRLFEASFYADGRDACLAQLSDRLDTPLLLQLACSTDFDSRILWPESLDGRPLLDFRPVKRGSLLGRLRQWLLPEVEQTLTGEVARYIAFRR